MNCFRDIVAGSIRRSLVEMPPAPASEYLDTDVVDTYDCARHPPMLSCRRCGGHEIAVIQSPRGLERLLLGCNYCLMPMVIVLVNYGDEHVDLEFAGLS